MRSSCGVGFPNGTQHFLMCTSCNTTSNDIGKDVARQLTGQNQLLHSKTADVSMERSLMNNFSRLDKMINAILMLIAKGRGLEISTCLRLQLKIWVSILRESQKLFVPRNIKQCLPVTYRGITGTVNRLNKYQLTAYHQVPMPILPIVSGDDSTLCTMLFWQAHVVTDVTGTVHLSRALTISNLRCGFYGTHITNAAKLIDRLIKRCVTCAKARIKLNISQISEKWPFQFINSSYGLWTAVAIDILGSCMYQSEPLTR